MSEGLSTATPSVRYAWAPGVRLAHYSDTSRSVTATYAYDAAGQRTQSVVTSGSLTTTTTYTYEGLSLLSLTATSTAGSVTETWSLDYLLDSASRPYAAIYAASDAEPMVVGMVTTARGDVAGLVDETGAAFALYRTDAYGAPVEVSSCAAGSVPATLAAAIAARNPVRYAGYCFDEHSQLYYLSQRYYDPASRQFLSKDPARADGEESAYQYCGGDPVGRTDPSGQAYISVWVPMEVQGDSWCWAAAAVAVIRAVRGIRVSQSQFVSYVKGAVVHKGGTPSEVVRGLRHWGVWYSQTPVDSLASVNLHVRCGDPVIAFMNQWTNPFSAHVVVVYGCDTAKGTVSYMNPWGCKPTEPYRVLRWYTYLQSDYRWRWTSSVCAW